MTAWRSGMANVLATGDLLKKMKAAFAEAPIEQHTETYANGDTYTGGWRNNKREGSGELICANGELYIGEWKNDKKHGKGMRKWYVEEPPRYRGASRKWDGYIYDGQWKHDQRHGEGRQMWYENRTRQDWDAGWNADEGSAPINTWRHDGYTGQWKNDSMHGKGTSIYHSKNWTGRETILYDGEWKYDKKHGHGKETTTYSDNRKDFSFEDEWENDDIKRNVTYMSHDEILYGRGGGRGS